MATAKLTDATFATGNPGGRLTDAGFSSASAVGRLVDAVFASEPANLGRLGVGGVWEKVRGFVGVDGQWVPVRRYTGPASGGGVIIDPPPPPVDPPPGAVPRGPVRFDTLAEARAALGAPTTATYVTWDPLWTAQGLMLHEVFTNKMGANDILVLPERVDNAGAAIPYLIDSSNGFMAAGVSFITGQLPNDTAVTRIPIVPNSRCWFQMARGRRGIMGMGPNAVVQPSASSFTRAAQPITQDTGGTMAAYNSAQAKLQDLVGAQDQLIGFDDANPFCGNFTMRSRSFGGVAYSAIQSSTVVNVLFDAASRGHAGVPNGETGCVIMGASAAQYRIENVEVITADSTGTSVVTSPIMWNRRTGGGMMRNVKTGKPRFGMPTFWRCDGTQTWTDVYIYGNDVGLNLEEGGTNFALNWTGGSFQVTNRYHIVGESSAGSKKVTLVSVDVIEGVGPVDTLNVSIYSYNATYVQKKADITRTGSPTGPVNVVGFAN